MHNKNYRFLEYLRVHLESQRNGVTDLTMDRIVQGVSLNETQEVGVDLTGAQLCSRVDAFQLNLLDEDLQDC